MSCRRLEDDPVDRPRVDGRTGVVFPADVLTRLDRKIQVFEIDTMATAVYAVIDPSHTPR